jgi:hypothetical protein
VLTVSSKARTASAPSRLRLLALGCLCQCAIAGWGRKATAQGIPAVELHWTAPAACPGAEDLQRRVRHLLGPDASAIRQERLVIEGVVTRSSQSYRLKLGVWSDGHARGHRSFESDSCESLAGAAAVTLALLARGGEVTWDEATRAQESGSQPSAPSSSESSSPESRSSTSTTSQPPSSPTAPAPAPPLSSQPAPPRAPSQTATTTAPKAEAGANQPEPPPEDRWYALLQAPLFVSDEGTLPSGGLGAGIGVGARRGRFDAILAGAFWLDQSDAAASGSPYGARYVRRSGKLSGCYAWLVDRVDIGPCLSLGLEYVTAHGTGPDVVDGPGHFAWATAGLAARARWSPTRWMALFLCPSLTVGMSRPIFAIDAFGPIFKVPTAAAGLDLGSEWIF